MLARGIGHTAGQDGAAGLGSGVWSRLEPDRPTAGRAQMNCQTFDALRSEISKKAWRARFQRDVISIQDDVDLPSPVQRKAGIAMPSRMAAPVEVARGQRRRL